MRKPVLPPWEVSFKRNTWRSSMKIMGTALFYSPSYLVKDFGTHVLVLLLVTVWVIAVKLAIHIARPFVLLIAGFAGFLSKPEEDPPTPTFDKEKKV